MYQDDDPIETSEWLDALESLIENEGVERVKYILERLSERASRDGTELPYSITTPFRNSIPVSQQTPMPGDLLATMSDNKSITGGQDRKRINVNEDYELRDWAKTLGVSPEELKAAVAKVGPMADDVRKELGK